MTAMNRRSFVRHTAGAATAAVLLKRFAAAKDASVVSSAVAEPRIRGSFFSQFWTRACLAWKEENWRALIRDMHGIGIDTAICIMTASDGKPVLAGYDKTIGPAPQFGCADPLGACVDEADALGMKMFFGVGLRGQRAGVAYYYPQLDSPRPNAWYQWNADLAKALMDRFANRPCFAGLYISYEIDYHGREVDVYEKLVREYLRPAVGKVKILASPGNLGVEHTDRQLEALPKLVERTSIDILAPQDYAGRYAKTSEALAVVGRQVEALKKVRKPLADLGVALWANCEVFGNDPGPDGKENYSVAGPFERVRQQIEMQAPLVEKLICFEYPGFMNRRTKLVNIGERGSDKLYQDYVAYLKQRFG
jgi:hypothetical protein